MNTKKDNSKMKNNVVLVTVDSLRYDHVGHLSEKDGNTPNIDWLANDGISCSQSYANGIPTYFAFRSILGGRRDLIKETPIGLPPEWPTLAEEFSKYGYDTAGFNAANPWVTADFGYKSGFDTFVDFLGDGESEEETNTLVEIMKLMQNKIPEGGFLQDKLGLAARTFCTFTNNYPIMPSEIVTKSALDWINSQSSNSPFFLWVHYMDPHYPWTPASEDISQWEIARTWHNVSHIYNKSSQTPSTGTLEQVKRLYKQEVAKVDAAIGELVDRIGENAIVCVTADHGTELGDRGGFSHGPDSLYNEVTRVPLVIHGPSIPQQTIQKPVQHVDIPPTLVELAVSESTIGSNPTWQGNNILDETRELALTQVPYDYSPTSDGENMADYLSTIVDWPWKLHWNKYNNSIELYHIVDDPGECEDLSREYSEKVQELQEKVRYEQEEIDVESRTADEVLRVRQQLSQLDK